MILIVTHKDDFTADYVVEKLNRNGINYYRLNCEDVLLKNNISIYLGNDVKVEINKTRRFNSVWFRRTKYPALNEYNADVKAYCYAELDSFFKNLWLSIETDKWLSKPDKVYNAENKLLQLRKAKEIGFNIPETIVTGDSKIIREFYESNNRNVIIKPLYENRLISNESQSLIFTNKLNDSDFDRIDDRISLPSIFQRYVEKDMEYRVTVVNDDVFAATVDSQSDEQTKIDWRKKKLKFRASEIPENIRQLCVLLTKRLGISFGAIDLIKDQNGDYQFLEINPNGQWAWIEMDTGMPISESIIKYLSKSVNHEVY